MYRIFIVEDDAAIAGVIRRHLEGWGYTVRCAERFDDVLSEFAAFDPPSGAAGRLPPLLQRLPLVSGDPPGLQGAHLISHLRLGQCERGDGHAAGRG